jgi:hypothetical protein
MVEAIRIAPDRIREMLVRQPTLGARIWRAFQRRCELLMTTDFHGMRVPNKLARALAVLAQPALPCLLTNRKVLGLHVLQVDDSAVTKKWSERPENPSDLLDRQVRALFVRVECSAFFGAVILNRLLHRLEGIGIGLPILPGEELHGPLIDQLFGGEFFPHTQLRERAIERRGRNVWVWVPDKKPCIDGAAASENQSRGRPRGFFAAWGNIATVDSVPYENVANAPNRSANSLQLKVSSCKYLHYNKL